MIPGSVHSVRWPGAILAGLLLLAGRDAPAQETCVSAGCHATLLTSANVHPVADSCDTCHEAVTTPHPQKGTKTFKLAQDPPELCFACHDAFGTKAQVHPPVKDGMCTMCHDPHSSKEPKLLTAPMKELCGTCHEEGADAAHAHVPVEAGDCSACHSPHESDIKPLLLKPEKETCLGCHESILPKAMTVVHSPAGDGMCATCHAPHGGANQKLLTEEYPAGAYSPYTGKEYALCFGCHERELVQDPETATATEFRDGSRNLHFLHVNNADKGRSCRLCHEPHAGRSPKLIADTVPFGKWALPLKFVKTETGGSCSPGCHKMKSYDRKTPDRKPAAPKPASGTRPSQG